MIELRVLLGVAGQKEICFCPLEGVAEDAERVWSEGHAPLVTESDCF